MSEMKMNVPEGFEKGKAGEAVFGSKGGSGGPGGPGGPGMFGRRGRGPMGMAGVKEKPKNTGRTLKRLIWYFGSCRLIVASLLIVVVGTTVSGLIAPRLQAGAIDEINEMMKLINKTDYDSANFYLDHWNVFTAILVAMAIVYLLQVVLSLGQSVLSALLSQKIVRRLRHDLFDKIDHLSIKYMDTHSNGDVMSRMTNDVENISNTISQSISSLVSGLLTLVGTLAIMFYYCWQLTLLTMITILLTLVITTFMSKKMGKIFRKRSRVLGRLNGHSEEMITGYKSIVAYNKQEDVLREFNETSDELTKVGIRAEILGGSMGPVMNAISNISFVIVAVFGGLFSLKGMISIGMISAFIIYAKQFSRPVNEIAQLYASIQTALAGAERVFELLDEPDESNEGTLELPEIKGNIEFKNVNFSYVEGHEVLHDVSLSVKPGQKIALVGATGSGKTTVVNLLMRFYPVDSGEILIDGVNICDLRRDFLRHNTAIVLQDTVLFTDTVERNIKYANFDAPEEQMVYAAQMSNSESFIRHLPDKYQTVLKQAGAHLSQGQRQLLAIARAVLADPKILILDEATSSVDTRTEKKIQDAMVKLMKNRTSLIIAHRLSTIRDADMIVVMEQGRVEETGTHEELLAKKGRYYALYNTQFAGNKT